jgi:hypothetical protein
VVHCVLRPSHSFVNGARGNNKKKSSLPGAGSVLPICSLPGVWVGSDKFGIRNTNERIEEMGHGFKYRTQLMFS